MTGLYNVIGRAVRVLTLGRKVPRTVAS
jgi:hypothetical protein